MGAGGVTQPPPPGQPVNLSLPTISGSTVVSATLTGSPGTWDQLASFSYQWLRNGVPIGGATGQTYLLATPDLNATISLRVTATNSAGSTIATSSTVGPISTFIPPPSPSTPAVTPWTFVICDRLGRAIGEPLATGRSFTVGISRTSTAAFTVEVGSRIWTAIAAGDATLKIYNSSHALVFFGDIVTDELTADGSNKTVAMTAADLSFRLARRYIGKSGTGSQHTAQDSGSIVFAELGTVNAEAPTGVTAGLKDSFIARTVTFNWRRFSDVIADLGAIDGSYEWTLRYTDGTPPTVYLDLETMIGSDQTTTVFFEFGTGVNNCSSYRRLRSIETLATRVYAIGQGSTISSVAYDAGAELVRRFEDVVSVPDISAQQLLDSLAAAHVAVRHLPRKTVTVTPFPATAPRFGVDWYIGDRVTLRSVVGGVVDTYGTARIWGAQIDLDDFGNEAAAPVLEPQ